MKLASDRALSTSLSFVSTLPLTAVASAVVAESGLARVGSSTGDTVMRSVLAEPVEVV